MANITLIKNPFDDSTLEKYQYTGRLIDFLQDIAPDGFGMPVHAWVNSVRIKIEDFDLELKENDFIILLVMPGGLLGSAWNLIYAVLAIVISFAVSKSYKPPTIQPPQFANQPTQNTVYSITAKNNAARVGEPIPVIYGEVLTTPDYASEPYTSFDEIYIRPNSYYDQSTPGNIHPVVALATLGPSWDFYKDIKFPVNIWQVKGNTETKIHQFNTSIDYINFLTPQTKLDLIPPDNETFFLISEKPDYSDAVTDGISSPIGENVWVIFNGPYQNVINRMYYDGEQYLHYFLSIGNEDHNIKKIMVGNTDVMTLDKSDGQFLSVTESIHQNKMGIASEIFNAQGAQLWLTPPEEGKPVGQHTIFSENVITSLDIGQQVLDDIETTNWYTISDQDLHRIAVDISFDRGLYHIDNHGKFLHRILGFDIEARNDITGHVEVFTILCTTGRGLIYDPITTPPAPRNISPLRRTLIFNVTPGPYSVRLKRTSPKPATDGTISDSFTWKGLKGYVVNSTDNVYNKTHLLAIRIRSTEIITSSSAQQVRVLAERILKLPDGTYSPTSNPAHHIYDVLTNQNYGPNRPLSELDMVLLNKLVNRFTYQPAWGDFKAEFNGVINSNILLYDVLKSILTPVACEPLPIGSLITFSYEGIKPIITQLFTEQNIVRDSLRFNYEFNNIGDPDGIMLEYRNPDTFQPEYIIYPIISLNPQQMKLFGCTNKRQAELMAIYLFNKRRQLRKFVQFETELEGLIPRPGDKIGLQHTLAKWGQSGIVLDYDPATLTLKISPKINIITGTHFIILRNLNGSALAPIEINIINPSEIILTTAPGIPINTINDENTTHFSIGLGNKIVEDFIVDNVSFASENTYTVNATVYKEPVFDNAMPFLKELLT